MYVCMYVCMHVHMNMPLHTLTGTVMVNDGHAQVNTVHANIVMSL